MTFYLAYLNLSVDCVHLWNIRMFDNKTTYEHVKDIDMYFILDWYYFRKATAT